MKENVQIQFYLYANWKSDTYNFLQLFADKMAVNAAWLRKELSNC